MGHYIGCDAHLNYSVFCVLDEQAQVVEERRVDHEPGAVQAYLGRFAAATPVAIETIGSWYWLVDEVEAAGCEPHLAHAIEAKKRMGRTHKTDRLDAHGLAVLLRNGTLPESWIADQAGRDLRELPRGRMALSHQRVEVKNRILATLSKYSLRLNGVTDAFGVRGRRQMTQLAEALPQEHRWSLERQLAVLDVVQQQIAASEERVLAMARDSDEMNLLRTAPGIGPVLAVAILAEIGNIRRFGSAAQFASYCGLVPTMHASGGKVRMGQLPAQCNRYLKWAFVEAANVIQVNHHRETWRNKDLVRFYLRIRGRRGTKSAICAVARRLAEAVWWMLTKGEGYREPVLVTQRPT